MNDKYWAYIHDASGELTEDLGEYTTLADAVDELISNMRNRLEDDYLLLTGRVVENATSTTVWIAGSRTNVQVPTSGDLITGETFDEEDEQEMYTNLDAPYGITPPAISGGIPADLLETERDGYEQTMLDDDDLANDPVASALFSDALAIPRVGGFCGETFRSDGVLRACFLPVGHIGTTNGDHATREQAIERMREADDTLRSYAN